MVKKIRRMRTFARTASKSMEKQLVENAKQLKKDPYIILPDYDDKFSEALFKKIKKNIQKVERFKEDSDKLEKLSKKKNLAGALAGTLLIAHSEKAPYLAVAKFPNGDVTYAQRGKAGKEQLIAIQHINDPVLRLLGIKNIALKTKIYVYSWDNGFLSTGRDPKPPEDFVKYILNKNGLSLKNNISSCPHIDPDKIKDKEPGKEDYLRIRWKSADILIATCESCVKEKKNTIFNISKYMIEPNISEDFEIDVMGDVVKGKQTDTYQETEFLNEYLTGKLSDKEFINKNMKQREEQLKESGERIFILDDTSYGTNEDEFIKALKPNKYEKEGLDLILKHVNEPVVINNGTPNKVLEKFWDEHGLKTISSIIDDEEMAKKFFSLEDQPSEILELVFNYKKRQSILSELPQYKTLPPLAKFIENAARTYKTFGEKKTLLEIKKVPDNPKGKSVSYAFLLVFGKGKDKKWKYSQVEVEYGEFLKDYVKKLLDSEPKDYHKNLQELLAASGSSENIEDNLK